MATLEELVIKLSADTGDVRAQMQALSANFEKQTKDINKSLTSVAQNTEKSSSFMRGALQNLAGFLARDVVVGGFNIAKQAASNLFQTFIVDGIKAASATEQAMTELLGTLQRTGAAAGNAEKDMEDFAGGLQAVTRFGDDAILSAAGLLQNIARLDREGLKSATKATADFAAAMNIDLNTAATLVGKAMDGNVAALTRYGIKIDAGATKSETMAKVLQQLEGRFGGAAQKAGQTFAGSLDILRNAFSDMTKVTGNAIIKNEVVISVFRSVGQAILELQNFLQNNQATVKQFFAQALISALEFAEGTVPVLRVVAQVVQTVIDTFQALGRGIGATAAAAAAAASGDFKGAFQIIKDGAKESFDAFDKVSSGPFEAVSQKLAQVRSDARQAFVTMQSGAQATSEPIRQIASSTGEVSLKLQEANARAKEFGDSLVKASQDSQAQMAYELESLQMQLQEKLISQEEFEDARLALLFEKQIEEQALLDQAVANGLISKENQTAAYGELEKRQTLELQKNLAERTKAEEAQRKANLQGAADAFGNLAALSQTGNKTLGAIGKSAAIAQATINTYLAATRALAEGGPFLGPFLAASITTAGLVQVAKIASTPLQSGIDSVPGIGSGDNFPAVLAPGERVVPARTNEDLTDFLKSQNQPKQVVNINVSINDVFSTNPREIGLKLIETINEAAQANGVKVLGASVV